MGKTSGSLSLRRSGRVSIGCPVRISGMLEKDVPFAENTHIMTLSKFGAKLKTRLALKVGMEVTVKPLRGDRSGIFKVVWVGQKGTARAGEVGVEYTEEIAKILGINFPDLTVPMK